jgi:hypothetical protein
VVAQGWFDDRVECRNALSKLSNVSKNDKGVDRKDLPWMETDERVDNPRLFDLNVENLRMSPRRRGRKRKTVDEPETEPQIS